MSKGTRKAATERKRDELRNTKGKKYHEECTYNVIKIRGLRKKQEHLKILDGCVQARMAELPISCLCFTSY